VVAFFFFFARDSFDSFVHHYFFRTPPPIRGSFLLPSAELPLSYPLLSRCSHFVFPLTDLVEGGCSFYWWTLELSSGTFVFLLQPVWGYCPLSSLGFAFGRILVDPPPSSPFTSSYCCSSVGCVRDDDFDEFLFLFLLRSVDGIQLLVLSSSTGDFSFSPISPRSSRLYNFPLPFPLSYQGRQLFKSSCSPLYFSQ